MKRVDKTVFEEIIEDNKYRIYRICKSYAVDPIEPEDLFQEVIFQIWKSLDSFKGVSTISTWVYRIALNVCYRHKLKSEKIYGKEVRLEAIKIISVEEEDEIEAAKYKALQACIKQLDKNNQSILLLYLEDLRYKEIAQVTGLSENHIAVKMKRIKKILFECITPKIQ